MELSGGLKQEVEEETSEEPIGYLLYSYSFFPIVFMLIYTILKFFIMIFYLFCMIMNIDPVKKHKGPTLMSEVHARKFEDRVPIFCNEHGQPIGPTEKACSTNSWELLLMNTHGHH